jgi:hypothetical protein
MIGIVALVALRLTPFQGALLSPLDTGGGSSSSEASGSSRPSGFATPATAAQPGPGVSASNHSAAAASAVRGPIQLQLRTVGADVEIMVGSDRLVTVRTIDGDASSIAIRQESATRHVVLFDGRTVLRCGKVCVAVPSHSDLDVATETGNVTVNRVEGNVKVRTSTGRLAIANTGDLEVGTITGDVVAEGVGGEARIDTVSGDVSLAAALRARPKVRFSSTSGDLLFTGDCRADCRIEAKSLSGALSFRLTPESSFDLHFLSHSGEIDDAFKMLLSGSRPPRETNVRARRGRGDGVLELQTFSGALSLAGTPPKP